MAKNQIYLIRQGDYHKIGVTRDPIRRLASLQTSTPYECELLLSVETDNALTIEQNLHDIYRSQLVRGEWYLLSDDDIDEVKEYVSRNKETCEEVSQFEFSLN